MRRIVLIDGENLRHAIEHILQNGGIKHEAEALKTFHYQGLIHELLADNPPAAVIWYGARLRVYRFSRELEVLTQGIIKQQAKLVNSLLGQGITFEKTGYLRARETKPCRQCKNRDWSLTEKGVDVGLAVTIITEAIKPETEIVVISADTDLLPACSEARSMGAKIMHIGYEFRSITALIQASDATRTISLPMVQKYLTASKRNARI